MNPENRNDSPANPELPANPSYGQYDPAFARDQQESSGDEFSFSDFFLDKFLIATGIAALAVSLFYARDMIGFPMFLGFLVGSLLSLAAVPAILAALIALPSAAVIAHAKNRPFKKAFKPLFTLLLFTFWLALVILYFAGSSHFSDRFIPEQ
jgi:hypothetical protein